MTTVASSCCLRRVMRMLLVALILGGPGVLNAQAPAIAGHTPAQQASSAARAGDVQATFSAPVTSNGDPTALLVYGSMSGRKSGTLSGDMTAALTFNPAADFKPGEEVIVGLRKGGVTDAGAVPFVNPLFPWPTSGAGYDGEEWYTWRFHAAAGAGPGNFGMHITPIGASDVYTLSIALGDVNGDGHVDIVQANSAGTGITNQQNVILLNDGTGNFTWVGATINLGMGTDDSRAVCLADLNNDGRLDVVIGNWGATNVAYINNGTTPLTFTEVPFTTTGYVNTTCLACADMNGDGYVDIVEGVDPGGSAYQNSLHLNDGANPPGFATRLKYRTYTPVPNQRTFDIALADINNDGILDYVEANTTQSMLLPGRGDGYSVSQASWVGSSGRNYKHVSAGDANRDGFIDLVMSTPSGSPYYFQHNGDVLTLASLGGFSSQANATWVGYGNSSTFADVDGDGDLDILYTDCFNINDGAATPAWTMVQFLSGGNDAGAADLDGDGDLDLVKARTGSAHIHFNRSSVGADTVLSEGPNTFSTLTVDDVYQDMWEVRITDSGLDGVATNIAQIPFNYSIAASYVPSPNAYLDWQLQIIGGAAFSGVMGSSWSGGGTTSSTVTFSNPNGGSLISVPDGGNVTMRLRVKLKIGPYDAGFAPRFDNSDWSFSLDTQSILLGPSSTPFFPAIINNTVSPHLSIVANELAVTGQPPVQWLLGQTYDITSAFVNRGHIDDDINGDIVTIKRADTSLTLGTTIVSYGQAWFRAATSNAVTLNAPENASMQLALTDDAGGMMNFSATPTLTNTFVLGSNYPPEGPEFPYVHSTDAQLGTGGYVTNIDADPVFSAIYSDPNNPTDTATQYQVQVSITSNFYNVRWDSGQQTFSVPVLNGARCPNIAFNFNGTATQLLVGGTDYWWRMRFWDDRGAVGPWKWAASTQMGQQFTTDPGITPPDQAPTEPTVLFVDNADAQLGTQGNPVPGITTPLFSALINDPDGSGYCAIVSIQVGTDPTFAAGLVWNGGGIYYNATHGGANGTIDGSVGGRFENLPYGGAAMVDATRYYWRIKFRVGNLDSPWSTEPASFTYQGNLPPSAPTQLYVNSTTAQNGTQGNPVAGVDLTPVFSAVFNDPISGDIANKYRVDVATDAGFSNIVWNSGASGTAMPARGTGQRCWNIAYAGPTLAFGTTYSWRIKFWDDSNAEGAYSTEAASFTTKTNTAPPAPTQLYVGSASAQNGNSGNPVPDVGLNPAFSAIFNDADAGDIANKYRIQVSTDATFATVTHWNSTAAGTTMGSIAVGARSANIPYGGNALAYGTTYYWRIKFWDGDGVEGAFSTEAASFTTSSNQPPLAPTTLYVHSIDALNGTLGNPAVNIDIDPVFSAIYVDANVGDTGNKYRIQVATDGAFTSTIWDSGVNGTAIANVTAGGRCANIAYAGPVLQYVTVYYWRVKFWDAGGLEGPFSTQAASFETMAPNTAPSAPTVLYVSSGGAQNGAAGNPVLNLDRTPAFSAIYNDADPSDIADKYQIQVATDSAFTALAWDSGAAGTPMAARIESMRSPDIICGNTPLLYSTTYYWRIKFFDDSGAAGAWSATSSFVTEPATPPRGPSQLYAGYWLNGVGWHGNPVQGLWYNGGIFFSAMYDDVNSGDQANYMQLQVSLDPTFTQISHWDSGKVTVSQPGGGDVPIGGRNHNIPYIGSPIVVGIRLYWRAKFWDIGGLEGDWSTVQVSFTTVPNPVTGSNNMPDPPSALYVGSTEAQTGTQGFANAPVTGIDVTPVFSAVYEDFDAGDEAILYRIQVATDPFFPPSAMMWDSGLLGTAMTVMAKGSRCPDIAYAGTALQPNTSYYWRMKFWDKAGLGGAWSALGALDDVFVTGGTVPAPTITTINPAIGSNLGGTSVTITGANFFAPISVTFDGLTATLTSVTSTQLVVTTPAHAVAKVDVVIDANGQSVTSTAGYEYVVGTPLALVTSSLPQGREKQVYGPVALQAAGGTAPYIWTVVGLPSGMKLAGGNLDAIGGTPAVDSSLVSPFSVDVTVTDSLGTNASRTMLLVIAPASPPLPPPGSDPTGPGGMCGMVEGASIAMPVILLAALLMAAGILRSRSQRRVRHTVHG